MPHSRNGIVVAVVLIACVVAVRLALPSIVKSYVSRNLHAMQAYQGSVDDIDLHLWRGAYSIVGMRIIKTGGSQPVPFFNSEQLDLSVEWKSLLQANDAAFRYIRPGANVELYGG